MRRRMAARAVAVGLPGGGGRDGTPGNRGAIAAPYPTEVAERLPPHEPLSRSGRTAPTGSVDAVYAGARRRPARPGAAGQTSTNVHMYRRSRGPLYAGRDGAAPERPPGTVGTDA